MEKVSKDQELNIVKKYLTNGRLVKLFARSLTISEIELIESLIKEAFKEKKEEFELRMMEAEELEQKRQDIIAQIEAQGFNVADLLMPVIVKQEVRKQKGEPKKRKPKYLFTGENGEMISWSGAGRTPLALRALLEAGHQLEEFLIKD